MIAVIVLVILDRITKLWIVENHINLTILPKILNFTYVENRGMVFGLAQGSGYIMGIVSLVICVLIVLYIMKIRNSSDGICFGWYMILAGGIGNAIDRLTIGYVVDFIDTPWIATFNLADTFIVLGIIVLIIHAFSSTSRRSVGTGDRFW
ncbi:MAG: signal peptidase II [Clostridia bacterium]|nr:signal peptidase II [Clostridia bacterium]